MPRPRNLQRGRLSPRVENKQMETSFLSGAEEREKTHALFLGVTSARQL